MPARGPLHGLVRATLLPFFPACEGLPGLAELDVDGFLAKLHRESTPIIWWGLAGACLLVQMAPLVTVGRPWPLALLRPRLAESSK